MRRNHSSVDLPAPGDARAHGRLFQTRAESRNSAEKSSRVKQNKGPRADPFPTLFFVQSSGPDACGRLRKYNLHKYLYRLYVEIILSASITYIINYDGYDVNQRTADAGKSGRSTEKVSHRVLAI
jgi:hypothetical protein